MSVIRPAFKMHGGKRYLSPWVIENFPPNYEAMTYLEPYAGAASVLINKNKAKEEAINDLDVGIVEIFHAIRDEPKEFIARLKKVKYTEDTFLKAKIKENIIHDDYMDHAVNEFILRRMSRGGLRNAFAWSERKRGGIPGDANAWRTSLDVLPIIASRLQGVFIFNKSAIDVIKAFNSKNVIIYADPPYLPETRTSQNVYQMEMSENDHIKMGETLCSFSGKVIVSGYPSALYNRLFKGWKCVKKKIVNHASQQKTKNLPCYFLKFT